MPYDLVPQSDSSQVVEAVNYLLNNFSAGITADPVTGQVVGPNSQIIGYLYQYMAVKYADSADGSVNFSDSPTNRQYYGLRNSNSDVESTNPADYVWTKVTGGFGTTKKLWYQVIGGRQIQFVVATSAPDVGWAEAPTTSINLDVITSGSATAATFTSFFAPTVLQVPRSGSPLTPSFSGITPSLYAADNGSVVPFTSAQTDSDPSFVNNSWRIGNSATTGNGDIVYSNITVGAPTDAGTYAVWPNPTAMASSPAYIYVPVRYKSSLGFVSQAAVATLQLVFVDPGATGPAGATGATGNQTGTAYLYQWSPVTPTNPSGSSTFVWASASNTSYTGAGGWSTTVPTNPGTPGLYLWVASKGVTDVGTATSTTVSWTSGYSVVATNGNGTNGVDGVKSTKVSVFQWAVTIPTITGTSTYTWSTQSFTPVPSGWTTSSTAAPSPGYTLWEASVQISDSASATTTSINWTTASILAAGYAGNTGASSRICYSKTTLSSLSPTPSTITTSGGTSFPPNDSWGTGTVWQATPPSIVAGESVYQSDGIYDSINNQTVWNVPYLSALKVGQLSAITVNTGALTIQDTLTMSSLGKIRGGQTDYNTGTGFFLGYSGAAYKMSIGNPSGNYLTWDGSNLNISGSISLTNTIPASNVSGLAATATSSDFAAITGATKPANNADVTLTAVNGGLTVTGGGITLSGGGSIKGGQTAYNTGTGFFLGYSGTTYKFSIGSSTTNMLWDGSSFTINGAGINGGSIGIGSGSTPSGKAFEVLSTGTVYADNLYSQLQFCTLPTSLQQFDDGAAISATALNSSTGYTKVSMLALCPNSTATTEYVHAVKAANYKTATNSIGIVGTYLGYDFYAAGAATNYGPFTGAHDAVMTADQYNAVELGDIVYDFRCIIRKNLSNTLFEVKQADTANHPAVVGVVVVKKDLLANNIPAACIQSEDYVDGQTVYTYDPIFESIKDSYYAINMNAVGEGMINVCGENGDIAAGDLIVSSSIPGKGMKQADDVVRSITVAKARESMTFSSPTEVKQIACIYLCG